MRRIEAGAGEGILGSIRTESPDAKSVKVSLLAREFCLGATLLCIRGHTRLRYSSRDPVCMFSDTKQPRAELQTFLTWGDVMAFPGKDFLGFPEETLH